MQDDTSSSIASDASTTVWHKCRTCEFDFVTGEYGRFYKHCRDCFEKYKEKRGFQKPVTLSLQSKRAKAACRIQSEARRLLSARHVRMLLEFGRRYARAYPIHVPVPDRREMSTQTDAAQEPTAEKRDMATCTRHENQSNHSVEQRLANAEHEITWLRAHVFETMSSFHQRMQALEATWPALPQAMQPPSYRSPQPVALGIPRRHIMPPN